MPLNGLSCCMFCRSDSVVVGSFLLVLQLNFVVMFSPHFVMAFLISFLFSQSFGSERKS